jgi:Uma2 family endonuclease
MVMNIQGDDVRIPVEQFTDLAAFCRWAKSPEFPTGGRFSYFHGEFWVDLSMEQLFTHNRLKLRINAALDALTTADKMGYVAEDRMFLRNDRVGFATEPDGMFVSMASIESEKAQLVPGVGGGVVEIVGAPDMVLEVISDSSEQKDTVELMESYWLAGISEYWLVDGRGDNPRFEILKRGNKGYAATRRLAGGWQKSGVFGRTFRLNRHIDALGHPQFNLEIR